MNEQVEKLESVKLPRKFVRLLGLEAERRDKFRYQIAMAMAKVWTDSGKAIRDRAVARSKLSRRKSEMHRERRPKQLASAEVQAHGRWPGKDSGV